MATLNLPKSAVLEKLEAARDELGAKHDVNIQEWRDELARRKTDKDDKTVQSEWYAAIAAGLLDGSVELTPTGKLRGGPPKPGTRAAGGSRYSGRRNDWGYYNEEQLEVQIKQYEERKEYDLKPFNTAIELLNLTTDETVEVDSANYQNLLNGNTRAGGNFW